MNRRKLATAHFSSPDSLEDMMPDDSTEELKKPPDTCREAVSEEDDKFVVTEKGPEKVIREHCEKMKKSWPLDHFEICISQIEDSDTWQLRVKHR